MLNPTRTSSALILFVLFSAAVFAQEEKGRRPEPLSQKPDAPGVVYTAPLPAGQDSAAWKEHKSAAGRFSILFPGTPQEETEHLKSGGHEVVIPVLKLNALADYVVMYFDIPMPRDMSPAATRNLFNSSVKQATGNFQATPLEQKEITLDGHPGLSVRLRLSDRSVMRLNMYAVGRRMYQLMITTPPEQGATDDQRRFYEATADKFLNSFTLAPVPPLVIAGGSARGVPRPAPQDTPPPPLRAPITGGILNGKAISKPTPRYPAEARKAGVSGMVHVAIVIDEKGKVISAEAVSGPDELREAAVEAALKTRFSPTRLSGQPVKVSGRLAYHFSPD